MADKPEVTSWTDMLRTARGLAIIVFLLAAILILTPQTEDMLALVSEYPSSIWPGVKFHLGLFFLAFMIWYWAQAVLSARFAPVLLHARDVDEVNARLRAHNIDPVALKILPRALFHGVAASGIIAAITSSDIVDAIVVLVWAGSFDYLVLRRLTVQQHLSTAEKQTLASLGELQARRRAGGPRMWLPAIWGSIVSACIAAPFGPPLAFTLLALATGAFFFSAFGTFLPSALDWSSWPYALGVALPGPTAALFCLAFIIGPLAVITYTFDLWRIRFRLLRIPIALNRPPVITSLALVITITPALIELHNVRVVTDSNRIMVPQHRVTIDEYFEAWKSCAPSAPMRPIIVAVSGGASRAALWGARVLMDVDDVAAEGRTAIFAVSSVSGGSVGTAAYQAVLAGEDKPGCTLQTTTETGSRLRQTAVLDALQADALGPLLAGSLIGDIPRGLVGGPAKLFHAGSGAVMRLAWPDDPLAGRDPHLRGGDRAEALERALEGNWGAAVESISSAGLGKPLTFDRAYLALFYRAGAEGSTAVLRGNVPMWIANGTDAQNGDRLLTVPFRLDDPSIFPAARDVLALLGSDVPISTAIDNTARFPFLSPSGELAPVVPSDLYSTQIIDGGYFENNGLQTALELARWLKRYGAATNQQIEPIIVQVTAGGDEDIEEVSIVRCGEIFRDNPSLSLGSRRLFQVMAPLSGLYSVRGGHTRVALREAYAEFCREPERQSFFHFHLYKPEFGAVPLNWVLSRRMAGYIWDAAMQHPANRSELMKLRSSLRVSEASLGR